MAPNEKVGRYFPVGGEGIDYTGFSSLERRFIIGPLVALSADPSN
jgi:hypothetical protein